MRGRKWITSLQALVNSYSVDTELDAPDWLIAEQIDSFISNVKMFSRHQGYTPLNNAVCTILQQPTAKGTQCRKNKKRVTAPFYPFSTRWSAINGSF